MGHEEHEHHQIKSKVRVKLGKFHFIGIGILVLIVVGAFAASTFSIPAQAGELDEFAPMYNRKRRDLLRGFLVPALCRPEVQIRQLGRLRELCGMFDARQTGTNTCLPVGRNQQLSDLEVCRRFSHGRRSSP